MDQVTVQAQKLKKCRSKIRPGIPADSPGTYAPQVKGGYMKGRE